jgi:hypothetical protein
MMAGGAEVLDEGLSRIAQTGPEFGGGLSNHAPMAAEALVRLGRADAVEHWLDDYLGRLDEPPKASEPITAWREALGQMRRVADWEVYFRDQMTDEPWQDVLTRWWPRLLPGVAAAATHGVIRTSHAARSLTIDTAQRRDELARGLAYWAAAYLELPVSARAGGHLDLTAALAGLPIAPAAAERGLITEQLKTGLAGQPASRKRSARSSLRPTPSRTSGTWPASSPASSSATAASGRSRCCTR